MSYFTSECKQSRQQIRVVVVKETDVDQPLVFTALCISHYPCMYKAQLMARVLSCHFRYDRFHYTTSFHGEGIQNYPEIVFLQLSGLFRSHRIIPVNEYDSIFLTWSVKLYEARVISLINFSITCEPLDLLVQFFSKRI